MLGKLRVGGIIRGHFSTLKNYGSGRYRPIDILVFTLLPLAATTFFMRAGGSFSSQAATSMSTAAPALTLAAAILLQTVYRVAARQDYRTQVERKFTLEIIHNLFYTVLWGVVLCTTSLLGLAAPAGAWQRALEGLSVFAGTSFLLALLMSLNRTHVLIRKSCELDDEEKKR